MLYIQVRDRFSNVISIFDPYAHLDHDERLAEEALERQRYESILKKFEDGGNCVDDLPVGHPWYEDFKKTGTPIPGRWRHFAAAMACFGSLHSVVDCCRVSEGLMTVLQILGVPLCIYIDDLSTIAPRKIVSATGRSRLDHLVELRDFFLNSAGIPFADEKESSHLVKDEADSLGFSYSFATVDAGDQVCDSSHPQAEEVVRVVPRSLMIRKILASIEKMKELPKIPSVEEKSFASAIGRILSVAIPLEARRLRQLIARAECCARLNANTRKQKAVFHQWSECWNEIESFFTVGSKIPALVIRIMSDQSNAPIHYTDASEEELGGVWFLKGKGHSWSLKLTPVLKQSLIQQINAVVKMGQISDLSIAFLETLAIAMHSFIACSHERFVLLKTDNLNSLFGLSAGYSKNRWCDAALSAVFEQRAKFIASYVPTRKNVADIATRSHRRDLFQKLHVTEFTDESIVIDAFDHVVRHIIGSLCEPLQWAPSGWKSLRDRREFYSPRGRPTKNHKVSPTDRGDRAMSGRISSASGLSSIDPL